SSATTAASCCPATRARTRRSRPTSPTRSPASASSANSRKRRSGTLVADCLPSDPLAVGLADRLGEEEGAGGARQHPALLVHDLALGVGERAGALHAAARRADP